MSTFAMEDLRSLDHRAPGLMVRFNLTAEQTVELIVSIKAAVQAGLEGRADLKDKLIRETEQRFGLRSFRKTAE